MKEEEVKKIVDWQFSRLTNLLPEAYKDALNIIAHQVCQLFEPAEGELLSIEEMAEKTAGHTEAESLIIVRNLQNLRDKAICEKECQERLERIVDAYEGMLDGMGKGIDNFKKSDWEYVQEVKKQEGIG